MTLNSWKQKRHR